MFSVIHRNCATGYYSFGHGACYVAISDNAQLLTPRQRLPTIWEHSTIAEQRTNARMEVNAVANGSNKFRSQQYSSDFNYGYRDPAANFRSILAYHCTTGQCDANPGGNCPRVQRFSNTEIDYQGSAIGNANNNNALQINNVLAGVAAYYPAVYCINDSQCDDGDASTFDACDLGNNACVYSSDPIAPTSASPTPLPAGLPTPSPITSAPTADFSGYSSFMQTFTLKNVDSSVWLTVDLGPNFRSPIVVCSVNYDGGTGLNPAVVRVRNVLPTSFETTLQNPSGDAVSSRGVSCVAIEEGVWKFPDGRKIEAASYMSSVTDHSSSWAGEVQAYQQLYTNPAVLGQVGLSTKFPYSSCSPNFFLTKRS